MTTTYESRVDIDHETIIPRATLALSAAELQDIMHAVYQGIQYETHVSHNKAAQGEAWKIYNALGVVQEGLLGPITRPIAPDPQPQPDIIALQAKVNQSHADGLLNLQEQQFQVFSQPIVRRLSDEQVSHMVSDEEWSGIAEMIGRGLDQALDQMLAEEPIRPAGHLSIDNFAEVASSSGTVCWADWTPSPGTPWVQKGDAIGYITIPVPEDILAGEHENHDDEPVLGDCGA